MGRVLLFVLLKWRELRRVHHVIHPLMQVHQRIQTVLNGYHQVDLMRLKYRLQ